MNTKPAFQTLLRNILIITILIIGLILVQQKIYNDYIRESISSAYINDLASRAEEQFKNFYRPVVKALNLSLKYGQSGLFSLNKIEKINTSFIPILEEIPQLYSAKIVNDNNDVFYLTREGNHWISAAIKNQRDPHRTLLQRWSEDGNFISDTLIQTSYNAFKSPWYRAARDSAQVNEIWWTKLRKIESAGSYGITACVNWSSKNDSNRISVIAFDILFKEVYNTVSNIKVTDNSRIFLFNSEGTVMALSTDDSLNFDESLVEKLIQGEDLKDRQHISDAIGTWKSAGMPLDEPIEFSDYNRSYWLGVRLIDRARAKLWIGILIPTSDMLNQLQARQMTNFSFSAAIFLMGIFASVLMVRRYRRQITPGSLSILGTEDPEVRLEELINKGESSRLEFKSTMRMNLKTNQPGKEIELAWLKAATAFMNSEGGILLLGVDDEGNYIGLEADKFENEDKCLLHFKNLINQHVGAQFTNYLNFGLLNINKKTIGVLECTSSKKPVFLKNKNEEHFFIRSGPSSIKLQTSKILEYIEDRKS